MVKFGLAGRLSIGVFGNAGIAIDGMLIRMGDSTEGVAAFVRCLVFLDGTYILFTCYLHLRYVPLEYRYLLKL